MKQAEKEHHILGGPSLWREISNLLLAVGVIAVIILASRFL
ncbi:hypothetical protein [Paenibacillus gansuensis]|uniref:Uncharacterized protein n=1 Tax=Paenibacillus gansuensis TaxID=306542 RepID=A0ABW5PGZ1_9BACL